MLNTYYNFWGKADTNGDYHCLPCHCLDVAAIIYGIAGSGKLSETLLLLT